MTAQRLGRFGAVVLAGLLAAAALAAAGMAVGVARAAPSSASYFVSPGGLGSCTQASPCQLQAALPLAAAGDTVYLAAGVYHGIGQAVISVTRSIKLQGGWSGNPSGPPVVNLRAYPTTLNGDGSRRAIFVGSGLTPTIKGFIITGGNATGLIDGCLGGSAKGCGGGMYVYQSAADIEDNTFVSNTAVVTATGFAIGYGGGLYVQAGNGSVISHNVFMSNTGAVSVGQLEGEGGGLAVSHNNHKVLVANNLFSGNRATQWAGGLAVLISIGTEVRGNLFQDNAADSGGGLYVWYASATVEGNILRGNSGDSAAYLGYFTGPFDANLVVDNPAVDGILAGYGQTGTLAFVYNNIVGPNATGLAAFADNGSPLDLYAINNTLVGAGGGTGLLVTSGNVTLTAINTLVSGFSTGIRSLHPASVSLQANYTLFDLDVGAAGNASFSHNVFGAAAFVNAAGRDYHLTALSAARDAGTSSIVSNDFDGDSRPIGPFNDIGADETRFVAAVFLPLNRK